ncbi:isopentenyl phosphate kinase family protein [Methanobrevibacter sp. TMH8]|uniref:isopentenyl phosphate kinase n=1 Tax=Methanobrevibacter sp. TMH8 TaxID=2848611 RepID=UPI001CC958DB|nr:isopentenyl phosphate kinase [Methanobrevibacter sp. TMH8]MBZ9571563.1 isopentenyl phosphate kinase family protein [Methanobrevibacter sp. TMH8]
MIILKLGGSILTKKDLKNPEVNYNNLNRIANEIKIALTNKSTENPENAESGKNAENTQNTENDLLYGELSKKLVIIHGAGSFGHPPAKKYGIGESFTMDQYPEKRIGFSKTQLCVKKLNTLICEVFINHGIPCVSIQASSFITTKNKRINNFNLDLIERYLKEGFVPVIYGDVVLDDDLNIAVLSGDQILQFIAKNLKINTSKSKKEVILGTDVAGVFTKNPNKYDDAVHIPKLSSLDEIEELDSTTNIDVTGGMIGKIKELLELANIGIESKIIDANEPNAILNALERKKVKGTIIKQN